jgi:hypothetical protein
MRVFERVYQVCENGIPMGTSHRGVLVGTDDTSCPGIGVALYDWKLKAQGPGEAPSPGSWPHPCGRPPSPSRRRAGRGIETVEGLGCSGRRGSVVLSGH